jgi:hypothetical protein
LDEIGKTLLKFLEAGQLSGFLNVLLVGREITQSILALKTMLF